MKRVAKQKEEIARLLSLEQAKRKDSTVVEPLMEDVLIMTIQAREQV